MSAISMEPLTDDPNRDAERFWKAMLRAEPLIHSLDPGTKILVEQIAVASFAAGIVMGMDKSRRIMEESHGR